MDSQKGVACWIILHRDKMRLDIFRLKDDGHIDPDSLPPPYEVAPEIVKNLGLTLGSFRKVFASA